MRLLVVTAVAAECDAIAAAIDEGASTVVLAGGIGPASSAAYTSAALAAADYDLVLSAGIAGGFDLPIGAVVVASRVVYAQLGRETPDGFEPLGSAVASMDVEPGLVAELAGQSGATTGTVLTVSTVTGTARTADALRARYPDAVAEAMEGFGVATAALVHGVPFGEIRAISNAVGPRDRAAWRVDEALAALAKAVAAVAGAA
ncbi:MAG TPA: futalosine hydrolase [Jatrophihabitantaceae bacterium]